MNAAPAPAAERLDERLVREFRMSRSRAATYIRAGLVLIDGNVAQKSGRRTTADERIIIEQPPRFVSRAGEKLAAALESFALDVRGLQILDIGISTGGFTDCLLQNGAARVVGIDVGHDQLAAQLRADARVELHEGINARELRARLPALEKFALITVDVSFISLRYIIPELAHFLAPGGTVIVLIKPQFEVGRERLGAGGIVRDCAMHDEVIAGITACARNEGFAACAITTSPILGSHGNREFLLQLARIEETNES